MRCYSAAAGLGKPEVEGRIVDLLKNFDKVRGWNECLGELVLTACLGYRCFEGTSCYGMRISKAVINGIQLSPTSHFANDLGLDSLDTVEVVMAIEEVSTGDGGSASWVLTYSTGIQHRDPR